MSNDISKVGGPTPREPNSRREPVPAYAEKATAIGKDGVTGNFGKSNIADLAGRVTIETGMIATKVANIARQIGASEA